ncbi:MAG: hypothetical protein ABIJ97_07135 [Bacteroidota bacterium]
MKKLAVLVAILAIPILSFSQRDADLTGLRQISQLYQYIYKDEQLLDEVKKIPDAKSQIEAMRNKYATEIKADPKDSIAIEITNAEYWLDVFIKSMKERYTYETMVKEFSFNLHMVDIHVKAALQTHDDPDGPYSMWKTMDKDFMKAATYAELMKMQNGESDTTYLGMVQKIENKEKQIEPKKAEGKARYIKSMTFSEPVDAYTGSDKEQIKAKVKELFQKECSGYIVAKTYITGADWYRNKGAQWDDLSKSFEQYDKSGIETAVICRKKTEPNSPNGFLVEFNLIKDHLTGTTKVMVFCSDIEYKKIDVPK